MEFEPKEKPSEISELMDILKYTEMGDALIGKESLAEMETADFMRREINNQIADWTKYSLTPANIEDPEKAMETMNRLRGFLDRSQQTGSLSQSEVLGYQKSIDELHYIYLLESVHRSTK